MKKYILGLFLVLFSATLAYSTALTGYGVSTDIPITKRYQFYAGSGFASTTSITVDVESDLGRTGYIGYIKNNTSDIHTVHINYDVDTGGTMNLITIPASSTFNFTPNNLDIDTLRISTTFGGATTIDVDVDILIH